MKIYQTPLSKMPSWKSLLDIVRTSPKLLRRDRSAKLQSNSPLSQNMIVKHKAGLLSGHSQTDM